MRSVVLLSALLLVLPLRARAEDPNALAGTEAVAPELLRGRSLVLERGNCSVDAPPGFQWLASPGMTEKHPEVRMFLCRDAKQSNIFMLQVYDKTFAPLDTKGMDDFLTGAQGSMEQQGWKFQGRDFKPSLVPIDGSSFRFSVKLLRKDGQTLYWVGYVATAQRMYCLSSMQLEPGERAEFNAFAKSFKLLAPVSSSRGLLHFLPYVLLSLVVGSVVVFIQTKREQKAKGEAVAKASAGDDDDDDVTDAFKPQPIVPSKSKAKSVEPARKEKTATKPAPGPAATKGETRRDERPASYEKTRPDEDSRGRRRPDEDSRQRGAPTPAAKAPPPPADRERRERRPDEKSDRERGDRPRRDEKHERPFG